MTNLEVLRAVQHVAWPAYCWPFGNGTGNGYTLVPSPSPPSTSAMGESKTLTSDNSMSRGSKRSRSQSQGHKAYEDQQMKINSSRKNSSNMESPSSSPPRTTKCSDVKSERLSPDTVNSIISNNNNCNISNKNNNNGDPNSITSNTAATNHSKGKPNSSHAGSSTPSPSASPKSQSSNRTRTPSSFQGTPPHPAFTPPISLPPGCFSPAALGGLGAMGALPGGPGNLAALTRAQQNFIEKQMPKNCSDLMRSLAAKYNNSNNNIEFYSTQIAKTFPRMPVSPVIPFKHSYSSATSALLHPSADQSQILRGSVDSINPSPTEAAASKGIAHHNRLLPPLLPQNLAPNPFTTAAPNHPLNPLSSTQAFIDMVRSSTVNNVPSSRVQTTHRNSSSENDRSFEEDKQEPAASPHHSHLNPSFKRMPESSCPLDLSSSFSSKRTRFEESPSPQVALSTVHEAARNSPTLSNASPELKTTAYTAPPPSCKPGDSILNWSVEDVCAFVESIDLCAEYAEIFREQRIDGWCLSLLTESHLTSSLKMKLGPALKLKNILATKTRETSCFHCTSSHNNNVHDIHEPDHHHHHHHRSTPSQRSPAPNHLGSPSHPYNEKNTGSHSEGSPYPETEKTPKSTLHNESMSSSSNDA